MLVFETVIQHVFAVMCIWRQHAGIELDLEIEVAPTRPHIMNALSECCMRLYLVAVSGAAGGRAALGKIVRLVRAICSYRCLGATTNPATVFDQCPMPQSFVNRWQPKVVGSEVHVSTYIRVDIVLNRIQCRYSTQGQ